MSTALTLAAPSTVWEAFESGLTSWDQFSSRDKENFVRHYSRKVQCIACKLRRRMPGSTTLNELMSAGMLGLMEAVSKFCPSLGIRFSTYADSRIQGAMLDDLRARDWLPRAVRQNVRTLTQASAALEAAGTAATEETLTDVTGLSREDVRQGLEAMQTQRVPVETFAETLSNDDIASGGVPYAETATKELIEHLAGMLDKLTRQEQTVLSLYYTEGLTMLEIAGILGVSEGRISQIRSKALAHLRRLFSLSR